MDTNKVFDFIGSKWFLVGLSLVMLAILPITYKNLVVVYYADMMNKFWYIPTVFIMNLLAAIFSINKTIGKFIKKKPDSQEEWN